MLGIYICMQRATVVLVATGIPLAAIYIFSGPLLDGVRSETSLVLATPSQQRSLLFILSVIISVIVLLSRDYISYIFTEDEDVSQLTPLLACTIILNGIQPVLSGVAVGCGWQALVAYVNLLGFYFEHGAAGISIGMIGVTIMHAHDADLDPCVGYHQDRLEQRGARSDEKIEQVGK
ncbi:hypothetical protein BAE44_0011852 [Dichanthelium oligosanthes]|uniref:Uncharacterized protein n=1 Tax=Dichanthelium oligosanthes TaxID=888268 RepID=A0A1E5VPS0_9POAL|nr:hypothetical protein BAE44_0011852 [Dichanthelium oligosanthes]